MIHVHCGELSALGQAFKGKRIRKDVFQYLKSILTNVANASVYINQGDDFKDVE